MTTMLIEWAATSVFLILTVLALRAAFGKRVSARLRYALWAVVLVRLLVPVQLFTSPIAGTRFFSETRTEQNIYTPPSAPSFPVAVPEDNAELSADGQNGPTEVVNNFPQAPAVPVLPDAPEPPAAPDLTKAPVYLGWVWLAGSAVMVMVLAGSNLHFARRLRRSRIPLEHADCPLPVYAAVGLPSPCLFGLVRPAVYVTPEAAASPVMLRHVIAHEYTHFRHFDHLWSFLRCAVLAAHWWNPLVWLAVKLSRRDGELACDEGAIQRLGDGERLAYGNTLLALVTAKPGPGDVLCFATTMAGEKRSLKERISRIACAPRRWVWAAVAVVLATMLACACAFGSAEEPKDEPEPDPAPTQTAEMELVWDGWELRNTKALTAAPDLNRNGIPETVVVGDVCEAGVEDDTSYGKGVGIIEEDELLWMGWGSNIHAGEDSFLLYSEGGEDCLMEFNIYGQMGHAHGDYRIFTLENGGETTVRENHVEFDYCTDSLASVEENFAPEKAAAFVDEVDGLLERCTVLIDTGSNYRYNPLRVDITWLEHYARGFEWDDGQSTLENLENFKYAAGIVWDGQSPEFWADAQVLDVSPDLNRDGVRETIKVMDIVYGDGEQPSGQQVSVWQGDKLLWTDEGHYAHAGWNSVFLCHLQGKGDYILHYNPVMYQGSATYSYRLVTLREDGVELVEEADEVAFDINLGSPLYAGSFDPEAIDSFMGKVNLLLAYSTQLINTHPELQSSFDEMGYLYDHLCWLDLWEPVFARDPDMPLYYNLVNFEACMEPYDIPTVRRAGPEWTDLQLSYHGEQAQFSAIWDQVYQGRADTQVLDLNGDGRDEIVVILTAGHGTGAYMQDLYVFDAETLKQYDTSTLTQDIISQIERTADKDNFYLSGPGMERVAIDKSRFDDTPRLADAIELGLIVYYDLKNGQLWCSLGCDASGITLTYCGYIQVLLDFDGDNGFQVVECSYEPNPEYDP